jgi:hypothetical protein
VLLGYLIDAGAPIPDSAVRFRLYGYARYMAGDYESGLLDLDKTISSDVKIDQWQPVEGGFYYHSADGIAHFLKGAAEANRCANSERGLIQGQNYPILVLYGPFLPV